LAAAWPRSGAANAMSATRSACRPSMRRSTILSTRAAVRAENCTRAKGQLKTLEDGIRMARTNANGEREILDDKGRADEMQRTRQIISSDCR